MYLYKLFLMIYEFYLMQIFCNNANILRRRVVVL